MFNTPISNTPTQVGLTLASHISRVAPAFLLAFALSLLSSGCSTPKPIVDLDPNLELQEELNEKLLEQLQPMIDEVANSTGPHNICLVGLHDQKSQMKLEMSDYLAPELQKGLSQKGVAMIERARINQLVQEYNEQYNVYAEQSQKNIAKQLKSDLVLLCPVYKATTVTYDISWKLLEIDTGKSFSEGTITIDRRNLPIQYGGRFKQTPNANLKHR